MSEVFISHSSKDKDISEKVLSFFEDKGISCWMAPRDIVPGTDWATAISTAITATKVFVLIYTANSAESSQVAREVTLAESKQGIFVVPYKTDDTPLKGSFEYYLTGSHFIIADYEKKDYKLDELYNIVSGIIGKNIQNITNNTYIDHLHVGKTDDLPQSISEAINTKAAEEIDNLSKTTEQGISADENYAEKKEQDKWPKIPIILFVALLAIVITVVIIKIISGKNDDVVDTGNNASVTLTPTDSSTPTAVITEPIDISPSQANDQKPLDSDNDKITSEINDAAESIMLYINKYGNHFENEKGEYYSIKHSYGPVTVNAGGENEATIENSRMYLTSRYKTSSESEFPLELGIYNKDLHLSVYVDYNIKTNSFELFAYEDEEKGKSKGIISIHLNNSFNGKIAEEDIYEYNESGWFGKDDFILNVEQLLTVLHQSLEEDFSEMEDTVSFELLGLANWKD
ncbi:MAG: toll/interleukin-1 receptor domain-containing protein [Lachnospiraceae bacterium]|nr:toll/interleukin-1 receptor domain-containing protein [Lachnospiraceae bacterium]